MRTQNKKAQMRWFFFHVRASELILASPEEMPERPADAKVADDGDPFRPWYQDVSHADEEHAHVCAHDLTGAVRTALELLGAAGVRAAAGEALKSMLERLPALHY